MVERGKKGLRKSRCGGKEYLRDPCTLHLLFNRLLTEFYSKIRPENTGVYLFSACLCNTYFSGKCILKIENIVE